MSEETNAFTADIHIDGIKAGYAKNDGRGGCTFYHVFEGKRELIERAEKYCALLPLVKYDFSNKEFNQSLESVIDGLVELELKKIVDKKLLKKMESAILWGVPDGIAYTQVKFKIPLAKIPLIQLQGLIDNYKKQFKRGEVFLNTNLEQLGVKL